MVSGRSSTALRSPPSVAGTAESGEDLTALRKIPVAEGVADRDRGGGPGAAAQHLVPAAEMHLRVLRVRERFEAGIGKEVTGGPFPYIAEHLLAAEIAGAGRIGS